MMLVSLGVVQIIAQNPYPNDKLRRSIGIFATAGVHLEIINTKELYVP
jgi:deoxycytidylate deaminase